MKEHVEDVKAGIANGSIEVPRIVTADPNDDPIASESTTIPGFELSYLSFAAMLGIIVLVTKSRRKHN